METFGIVLKGQHVNLIIDADTKEEAQTLIKRLSGELEKKFNFTVSFSSSETETKHSALDVI